MTNKVFFHLAFNPACSVLAQDKEIWGQPGRNVACIALIAILQFDLTCGLVIKLQDVGIMAHQVDERKFVFIALNLDRAPHFEAGTCSAPTASSTFYMASTRQL